MYLTIYKFLSRLNAKWILWNQGYCTKHFIEKRYKGAVGLLCGDCVSEMAGKRLNKECKLQDQSAALRETAINILKGTDGNPEGNK